MDVLAVDHLIALCDRDVLAVHYRLLCILCIFFDVHICIPPFVEDLLTASCGIKNSRVIFHGLMIVQFSTLVKKNLALFKREC